VDREPRVRSESDIAGVVEKQIELRLMRFRSRQIVMIQRPAIRGYDRGIGDSMDVLKKRGFGRQETPQGIAIRVARLTPVGSNGVPNLAKPFLIGVPVLRDDGAAGALEQALTYRGSVVKDVDREVSVLASRDFSNAPEDESRPRESS
jgi:hypothetical protein